MPGLPKPWSAYMHLVKKRIFYHNSKTGESLWELPADIREKCAGAVDELGRKFDETFSAHVDISDDIEAMDCTEWDDAVRNSPTEDIATTSNEISISSKPTTTVNECEDMEIDFTEDLRQVRGIHYTQDAASLNPNNANPFILPGTSRCCVVFDTCVLIDDPDLINDCIEKLVPIVIPYRVFYELDNMRKITSTSPSGVQLRSRATRLVHKLRDLRSSSLLYWESSSESFAPVDGFVTSSTEEVNDDFILKCAFQMKNLLEARGDGWETVFLTNDHVLSLKAHAHRIPCYSGKEAKAILRRAATPLPNQNLDVSPERKRPRKEVGYKNEIRVSPSGSSLTRLRRKDPSSVVLEKPLLSSAKKGKNKVRLSQAPNEAALIEEDMDALKQFSKIWSGLVSTLEKRLKKSSSKEKNEVVRLKERVSLFRKKPTEENLLMLVQMTAWLYVYYLPPSKEQKIEYKELLKNGLLKQISTPGRRSQRLMEAFRNFTNDFVSIEGEKI
uniref:WW domain-containing protein n=1 Tax=Haemonchus contortus TaxID=6289 RepID=A0A7I4Y2A3_HAECO